MNPKHIPGTWQFSGDWLGDFKVVSDYQDLGDPIANRRDVICPICEYPEALHLTIRHTKYPVHYYCPECGVVFQWYVAKCPDCGMFVWKKGCEEGKVKCSVCGMEWNMDTVTEINEEEEEYMEDE